MLRLGGLHTAKLVSVWLLCTKLNLVWSVELGLVMIS